MPGAFGFLVRIRRNNSRIHAALSRREPPASISCRDITRAQDHRRLLTQINDRRLDPDADRPSVQRSSVSLPSRSSATWDASVGLGLPDVLALGAAIRHPLPSISRSATGCFGIRIATVSIPPVVSYGTLSFFHTIMVSGPGQNASASFFCLRQVPPSRWIPDLQTLQICTISGLSEGRPFAA